MPILRQLSLLSSEQSPVDFPRQILGPAWPDNVWELQHYLERAVVATTGPELSCKDMVALGSDPAGHDLCTIARGATRQTERARIRQALQYANGNRARTAKLLKISRASLYNEL